MRIPVLSFWNPERIFLSGTPDFATNWQISSKLFDGNQTASGVYYGRISVKAGVGMAKASQTIKVVRRYVLSELSSDLAIKETAPNKKYWFWLCLETVLWFLANLRDSIASASWVSVVFIVCHSAGLATKDAKRWLQLFIPNNTTSVFIQSSFVSQLCLEARESKA